MVPRIRCLLGLLPPTILYSEDSNSPSSLPLGSFIPTLMINPCPGLISTNGDGSDRTQLGISADVRCFSACGVITGEHPQHCGCPIRWSQFPRPPVGWHAPRSFSCEWPAATRPLRFARSSLSTSFRVRRKDSARYRRKKRLFSHRVLILPTRTYPLYRPFFVTNVVCGAPRRPIRCALPSWPPGDLLAFRWSLKTVSRSRWLTHSRPRLPLIPLLAELVLWIPRSGFGNLPRRPARGADGGVGSRFRAGFEANGGEYLPPVPGISTLMCCTYDEALQIFFLVFDSFHFGPSDGGPKFRSYAFTARRLRLLIGPAVF